MNNDSWRGGNNDKTDTEYLPWCQKGHATETNYTVLAEYDSKFHKYK